MPFDATATFVQTPGCEVSQMPDGFVIYQATREKVHYLNPTASLVYDLCGEGRSLGAVAAFLQEAFSLPRPPDDDVARCIDQLLAEALVCPG